MTGHRLIRPINGQVNVGGGHETSQMTNLNPIKAGSGGPASGIPNHVRGSMEEMDSIFEPNSATYMMSSRLRFGDVDWPRGAEAAANVMCRGAEVFMNVWCQAGDANVVKTAFKQAGFRNVRVEGAGVGTIIKATR